MTCPKCGYENQADSEDCLRCGVIFAKIRQGLAPDPGVCPDASNGEPGQAPLEPVPANRLQFWGRAAALVVMIVWGGKLIFSGIAGNAAGESWLHLVNLPFHEAGHVVFRPLGQFITTLGGTLGQLLVPLLCMATLLLKTRDPFGAAVCFWWFGENFLDIAPYMNDARAGQLPLLGGNFGHSSPYGFHDWEYLLTETGLLRCDHELAVISHGIGSLTMTLSAGWAGYLLYRQLQRRSA